MAADPLLPAPPTSVSLVELLPPLQHGGPPRVQTRREWMLWFERVRTLLAPEGGPYQLTAEKDAALGYLGLNASARFAASKIANGAVSDAEFQALDGVTSALQTQIDTHAAAADPHTGYQKESEKDAASGYPGTDAGNGIILTGTPPAAPVANRLYKHPNAGGHLAVPLTAADTDAAIAGVLTAAQGGIAAGALEGWHEIGAASEPAFQNSWVNFGAGEATAAFRKLPSGLVVLKGLIKSGTVGAAAFTLPIGYRPALTMHFAASSNGAFGDAIVLATGVLRPQTGSNVWFALNFSFMAEA